MRLAVAHTPADIRPPELEATGGPKSRRRTQVLESSVLGRRRGRVTEGRGEAKNVTASQAKGAVRQKVFFGDPQKTVTPGKITRKLYFLARACFVPPKNHSNPMEKSV